MEITSGLGKGTDVKLHIPCGRNKLKKANITVITLRESKDAVQVIKREKPDLIILDWMMPEVSGIQICKTLKADPELHTIPVFMLTAKGQDENEKLGLQYGVARYITKPFSPKALLSMVEETLGKQSQE